MYKEFHSRVRAAIAVAGIIVASSTHAAHTGEGTFYSYSGGGNCMLPVPADIYTAAMNAKDYTNSKACGGVIVVTNQDNGMSVTVRIDDQCPECAPGDVDLTQQAFEQIAAPVTGRIPVSWKYIAYDMPTIKLYFKEGSSQWWTAVQVRDHRYRVAKLQFRLTGSGNSFLNVPRESYNYFVRAAGMGPGPYDFRITDVNGQVVKANNISLQVATPLDIGKQFPAYQPTTADQREIE